MKITFDFGIPKRTINVVNTQDRKGVKGDLEKKWRKYVQKQYPYLGEVPICCQTCHDVGEAIWHCHSDTSPHQHLNVHPWTVCSEWTPNQGLLMFLWKAKITEIRKADEDQVSGCGRRSGTERAKAKAKEVPEK